MKWLQSMLNISCFPKLHYKKRGYPEPGNPHLVTQKNQQSLQQEQAY